MKTIQTEKGTLIDVVEYDLDLKFNEDSTESYWFTILEGEFKDVQFKLSNLHLNEAGEDEDESMLKYSLDVSENVDLTKLEPVVNNIILSLIYQHIERLESID